MNEWRSVDGWPSYEVSNDGRVRSRVKRGRWPAKELRPGRASAGYFTVTLCDHGRKKSHCVHALVAAAFLGHRPSDRHEVAHNDGNRANNSAWNLRWATHAENIGDTKRHGTFWIGERHGNSRLTAEAVRQIRARAKNGELHKTLAEEHGVVRQTITKIVNGRAWEHLENTR